MFPPHPASPFTSPCPALQAPNRAAERRPEVVEVLKARGYSRVYDMSVEERGNKYFEGTGVQARPDVRGAGVPGGR